MRDSQDTQQRAAPEKVGVFISYHHTDLPIANVLRQSLIALSSDLDPFIDHVGIKAGDEYEDQLAQSISASQWFLMICSGPPRPEKDMGWCLYEAGQFRRKLLSEGSEELIRSRFIAIHDDDRPRQLAKFQSVQISTKDIYGHSLELKTGKDDEEASISFEYTMIYAFFETIIKQSRPQPLRDLTDPNVRSLLRVNARRLIRAYVDRPSEAKLPEIVLQPRISFSLPPTTDAEGAKLSPDTKVTGYESSLSTVFGINGTETMWGTIRVRCKEDDGNDPLWVNEIETAAQQVSRDFVPDQPDGLCFSKSDRKFYRVLFARYEPFRSGARTCYIVFIPCRPRGFDVRQRTSILLSALILSIRFRQRVLPFIEIIQALPRNNKLEGVFRLERQIHEVETEAQELGLSGVKCEDDDPPLVREFHDCDNKVFVNRCIRSWGTGRRALAEAIARARTLDANVSRIDAANEAADAAVAELKKVQEVNGKFIQVLTEEILFVEKVGSEA
jgi:hypothetical protein